MVQAVLSLKEQFGPAVLSLKEQFGQEVREETCDQCQFGLQVEGRVARKRTPGRRMRDASPSALRCVAAETRAPRPHWQEGTAR